MSIILAVHPDVNRNAFPHPDVNNQDTKQKRLVSQTFLFVEEGSAG